MCQNQPARSIFIFIFFIFVQAICFAQNAKISGKIIDVNTQHPVSFANIALMQLPDSNYVNASSSDLSGEFIIEDILAGNYTLHISLLGYDLYAENLRISPGEVIRLDTIRLMEKSVLLDGVEINDKRIPIQIRNDTIEYDAGSFPTREDAVVEDLLKKLPGVEVNRAGEIKAMGEKVNDVLVDGKPFFGSDPLVATRNLPANIIDKVQVFDKKSEAAEFSKIDDGNDSKTINLSLKEGAKTGAFGRLSAGGGTDERYRMNGNYNRFGSDSEVSLLAGGNNINEYGFGRQAAMEQEDDQDSGSPQIQYNSGPGMGSQGIVSSWNGGINFRRESNKQHALSGSYFYNQNKTENEEEIFRQNLSPGNEFNYLSNNQQIQNIKTHALNLRWDYKLDSFHSLIFKPVINFSQQENNTQQNYETLSENNSLINSGSTSFQNSIKVPVINGSLIFRKKFRKRNRTFSLNTEGRYVGQNGFDKNLLFNQFMEGSELIPDSLNQRTNLNQNGLNTSIKASYVEPLPHHKFLEFNYEWNQNVSALSRHAFIYNPFSEKYDTENPNYSNEFDSRFSIHKFGMHLKIENLKYNYTLGLSAQDYTLKTNYQTADTAIARHALSLFPIAVFKYNISGQKQFKLVYKGNTLQPGSSQLQPAFDIRDPQFIRVGNPSLEAAFSHKISAQYNDFNTKTMRSFFANANFILTDNRIVNDIRLLPDGRQQISLRNSDKAYTGTAFIGCGIPIKKWDMNIDVQSIGVYDQAQSFIDNIANTNKSFQLTEMARINYNYEELFDFGLNGSISYNNSRYSLQKSLNTQFVSYAAGADCQLSLPFGMRVQADVQFNSNQGGSGIYNRNNTLLNGSIGQQIFKKQGFLRLQVFDLLKQNLSVSRNATDAYLEDIRSSVLQQYWMLSFTWKLNQFGNPDVESVEIRGQ